MYQTVRPALTSTAELDYEAELAVIIGRGGRRITRERAFEHVRGYTILNDVTGRDLRRRHQQWFISKSLDTFTPMGPWAVTADEIADPGTPVVSAAVNGEPRQHAPVAELIFDIPELISVISAGTRVSCTPAVSTPTAPPGTSSSGATPSMCRRCSSPAERGQGNSTAISHAPGPAGPHCSNGSPAPVTSSPAPT
ncbi:fumarylacetoacetate hydrolase family protein [Streptomyces sp. NPDC054804]